MSRIIDWWQWAKAMGIRYIAFRFFYELQLRTGFLKWRFPINPAFRSWISLAKWRVNAPEFLIASREEIKFEVNPSEQLRSEAERIFNGEIQFFQGEWLKVPLDEWLLNVSTGYKYDNKIHWTAIPDFNASMGDIKYVWEKSRFLFLQTILRYDVAYTKDSSPWVFAQIESWIEHNPINQGPNYRCSQETSLRVFNWIYALYFYKNSSQLSTARFERILFSIYWQLKHVRENIHFSRIAVRNNHAITETLALYVAGILFPFFPESNEWRKKGKEWLEEEIFFQIYSDGGYLQYSFNYQRVVVQLLTVGFAVAHLQKDQFSSIVYERAHKMVELLATCQDAVTGQLPNYGANDGSLFFNWNDESYRNYRPSLDALHYLITGSDLYDRQFDDRAWFGFQKISTFKLEKLTIKDGTYSFDKAGLFACRQDHLLVMIVCVKYQNRPSQADNLHLDIWYKGENIVRDSGSYRYNADASLVKYFFGTESHNTIMIGENDQMKKGPRFIWLNWSRSNLAGWKNNTTDFVFEGIIHAFDSIGTRSLKRRVSLNKQNSTLTVTDSVDNHDQNKLRQLWHVNPKINVVFHSIDEGIFSIQPISKNMYFSSTYGQMETVPQLEFQTLTNKITTIISVL
jgi:hypothetical protein